ncbi:hypothetical protein OAQ99_00405 [Candidatus Kapabacteria bacterium]|nr:hypothetical protein [Candidatus Kapabacteria bacterium]
MRSKTIKASSAIDQKGTIRGTSFMPYQNHNLLKIKSIQVHSNLSN